MKAKLRKPRDLRKWLARHKALTLTLAVVAMATLSCCSFLKTRGRSTTGSRNDTIIRRLAATAPEARMGQCVLDSVDALYWGHGPVALNKSYRDGIDPLYMKWEQAEDYEQRGNFNELKERQWIRDKKCPAGTQIAVPVGVDRDEFDRLVTVVWECLGPCALMDTGASLDSEGK